MKLQYRRFWLVLGWCWVGVVLWLCLMPSPPELVSFNYADKLEHALTYALLMLWFGQLVGEGRWRSALLLGLLGVTIELLQGMGTTRLFEWSDIAANLFGVMLGWALLQSSRTHFLHFVEGRLLSRND